MSANQDGGSYLLKALLRIVLLLAIVGQIVFLASRYRTRVDVTADEVYTLTSSTRNVLGGLDDRLLIEAYFSSDENLSPMFREARRQLDNFLDELVQLSEGKVVIQRFDPHEDNTIKERATRLGIRGQTYGDQGDASFAFKEIWQGMRLMYGAERQDVIPFVQFAGTAQWEALLTPKIKALSISEKPKIGLLAFATQAGPGQFGRQGSQAKGYTRLAQLVEGRYQLQNISLDAGQLVPDDIEDLILVRPKNLTDRQKYAIDQFLMRGGNLVVFADTTEVEIGQQRSFRTRKVNYDAGGSELKFTDMLAHYGADVSEQLIVEALDDARTTEPFRIRWQTAFGVVAKPVYYPYWFHALPYDYAQLAPEIAKITGAANGDIDELVAKYEAKFEPGIDSDNYMLKAMKRGPGMFWACPVGVTDELPEGVTGNVLMRTSPLSFAEDPPPDVNPVGMARDPNQQEMTLRTFTSKIRTKLLSEPRQQFGLMAELNGPFPSFFEGKDVPPRKPETPDVGAQGQPGGVDPLSQPVGQPPVRVPPVKRDGGDGADGGTPAGGMQDPARAEQEPEKKAEAGQEPEKKAEAEQEPAKEQGEQEPAAAGEKEAQEPQQPAEGPIGPALPEGAQEPEAPQEPADPDPVYQAPESARLVVIGDADFIRDDLLSGEYGQLGPFSQLGARFFTNLVDWLAEEQDLLALQNKTAPDRSLQFADTSLMEQSRDEYARVVKERVRQLTVLNVVGPFAAIMLIWVLVALQRRARKQSFMARVQD